MSMDTLLQLLKYTRRRLPKNVIITEQRDVRVVIWQFADGDQIGLLFNAKHYGGFKYFASDVPQSTVANWKQCRLQTSTILAA